MPPAGGRFGQQLLSGPFSQHLPNSHLQHHPSQHQTPPSAGLPPPSFTPHQSFTHATPNTALNPFASTNGTNGLAAGFGGGGGIGAGGTGLASQAAVLGFAHGAVMQQQQAAREALRRGSGTGKAQSKNRIRDVWQGNLAQEMATIRELVDRYPYISMVCASIQCEFGARFQLLTASPRIPNSLGLSRDLWGNLLPSKIIITKLYAATLTCSMLSSWASHFSPRRATCSLRMATMSYQTPHIRIASYPVQLHGSSTFVSRYNTTCIIKNRSISLRASG